MLAQRTTSERLAATRRAVASPGGSERALLEGRQARSSSTAGARPTDTRALARGRKRARGALPSARSRVRITESEVFVTRAKQATGRDGVKATQFARDSLLVRQQLVQRGEQRGDEARVRIDAVGVVDRIVGQCEHAIPALPDAVQRPPSGERELVGQRALDELAVARSLSSSSTSSSCWRTLSGSARLPPPTMIGPRNR